MLCNTPACFSTFILYPYSSWRFLIFLVYLFVGNNYHAWLVNPRKLHLRCCMPQYINHCLKSELSSYYASLPAVTKQYKLRSVRCVIKKPVGKFPLYKENHTKEAIMCNLRINTFCYEWNTKKGTSKSMKNALYILRYVKRHLSSQSDIKSGKIKSIALTTVKLRWSEVISQAGS